MFVAALASALATTVTAGAAGVSIVGRELLGRPTDHAVTLKAMADQSVQAYVEYGTSSGSYSAQTTPAVFSDGMLEVVASGLAADTAYYYRLRYRASGSTDEYAARTEHRFRTQRARASTFTFDVQSDSHQGFDAFYSGTLYGVTLQNIANDAPDFLFDLGDAVSTDATTETQATVRQKYSDQRTFFELVGHSSPVFLVLGNHENEEGWNLDDMGANVAASLPVLGANARKRYFANPVPNGFYSGNADALAAIDGDHLRGDYYAFEWGSALFVAIDPFWYTTKKPYAGGLGGEKNDETVGDRWDWTLGKTQYDWLKQTLSNSTAPFKFVFAHHPAGGLSDYGRGGALGARYGEWGGYDTDGTTYAFGTHRPGWDKPIQEVFVDTGVTAFFHGHDHVFAMETLGGVVYQECPHAANPDYGGGFNTNPTDYAGAVLVNNSGHLRVTVSPTLVSVDYVRAYLPGDGENGSVAQSYTISPCFAVHSDGKACDDGNACTTTDRCENGACQGTGALACGDGNACTDDRCEPSVGCHHTDNTASCDDGNGCTQGDVCAAGQCAGVAVVCAALDECHGVGVCNEDTGACSNPLADEGTTCTGGWCAAGVCVPPTGVGGAGGSSGSGGTGGLAGGTGGLTGGSGGPSETGGIGGVGGTGVAGGGAGGTAIPGEGGESGAGAAGEAGAAQGGEVSAAAGRSGTGGSNARGGDGGSHAHGATGGTRPGDGGETSEGGAPTTSRGGSQSHGGRSQGGASTEPGAGAGPMNTAGEGGIRGIPDHGPIGKSSGCACRLPARDGSDSRGAALALLLSALAAARWRVRSRRALRAGVSAFATRRRSCG